MKSTTKTLAVLSLLLLLVAGCDDQAEQTDCERWAERTADCQDDDDISAEDFEGGCVWSYEDRNCEVETWLTMDCDAWDCIVECSHIDDCDSFRDCRVNCA